MTLDQAALDGTLAAARERLLAERSPGGPWAGELSSSALSTATAVWALASVDREAHAELIAGGLHWLSVNQNEDGGWGDSVLSCSNISTTVLCWSALAADVDGRHEATTTTAERWLTARAGGLSADRLADAIGARYGADRTFSAPILMTAALAGRLTGAGNPWRHVAQLPFELAVLPHACFRWMRLSVVSYALPALIAIGRFRHVRLPTRNPLTRGLRNMLAARSMKVLADIQPAGGGFLEATPLTSFIVMSLAGAGLGDCDVARRGVAFLAAGVRDDGSWPIDTDLTTWVTTLAVSALAAGGPVESFLASEERSSIASWLLDQQHRTVHPYTHAAPGGWAWTDLSGGVPDGDDTAGALLALGELAGDDSDVRDAVARGVGWLIGLANRDGGTPTFCRGWGKLPFDRSAPDLTAHTLAALSRWTDDLPSRLAGRARSAVAAAERFLAASQHADGSWTPLWFGSQHAPREENPTYGTARVLSALLATGRAGTPSAARAIDWLLAARNTDGGWGGGAGAPSSIEETALAVDALARVPGRALAEHVDRGAAWLIDHTDRGRSFPASPIGLYFARLWYFEKLYPLIFTVSALGRVAGRAPRANAACPA